MTHSTTLKSRKQRKWKPPTPPNHLIMRFTTICILIIGTYWHDVGFISSLTLSLVSAIGAFITYWGELEHDPHSVLYRQPYAVIIIMTLGGRYVFIIYNIYFIWRHIKGK